MSSIIQTHPKDPLTAIVHSREAFLIASRDFTDFHAVLWMRSPEIIAAAQKLYDDVSIISTALEVFHCNILYPIGLTVMISEAKADLMLGSNPNLPNSIFENIPLVRDDFLLAAELYESGFESMHMYHREGENCAPDSQYDMPHEDPETTLYFQYAGAGLRVFPNKNNLQDSWEMPNGSALFMRPECCHARAKIQDMEAKGRFALNYFK